jgi:hypothetical protein
MFLVCFFDNILITKQTQSPCYPFIWGPKVLYQVKILSKNLLQTLQGLVGDWRSVEGHTGEA